MYIFEHKLHVSFGRNYNSILVLFVRFVFKKINILNSSLKFDLSLQELKGDICHSHSSALAEHSHATYHYLSILGPSKQATFKPWRFSKTSIKVEASERESWVPVSSQANPLAMVCTFSCLSFRNSWFTVVISNSPRADGLICLATSTTLLG